MVPLVYLLKTIGATSLYAVSHWCHVFTCSKPLVPWVYLLKTIGATCLLFTQKPLVPWVKSLMTRFYKYYWYRIFLSRDLLVPCVYRQ